VVQQNRSLLYQSKKKLKKKKLIKKKNISNKDFNFSAICFAITFCIYQHDNLLHAYVFFSYWLLHLIQNVVSSQLEWPGKEPIFLCYARKWAWHVRTILWDFGLEWCLTDILSISNKSSYFNYQYHGLLCHQRKERIILQQIGIKVCIQILTMENNN
jgi:hypothetical protein